MKRVVNFLYIKAFVHRSASRWQSFYQHDAVQDAVPQSTRGAQVHVECMVCGFETVYGVRALIKYGRWPNERNGYPKWGELVS